MKTTELLQKYDIPVPRYTSYPTVPFWREVLPTDPTWRQSVRQAFTSHNQKQGMSMYIHLPYCESLCTYCGCNTRITVNHAVELPYIETLLQEWQLYLSLFRQTPLLKDLHLGGGTPTFFSPQNLRYLLENILKDCKLHDSAEFSFEAHPANTTLEHLQVLYDLHFRRLSLGIQDFDPIVQDTIHRFQSFEQVQEVTSWARQLGYTSVNYDVIYGLPKQTYHSIQDTIAQVISLRPDRIAFYSYAHVPWHKPGQRKFTEADLPSATEKKRLYDIGRSMLIDAGYIDIGMDHFALPSEALHLAQQKGQLHRNFMGYTDQKTELLVGLGASAISEVGQMYVQNPKTVEGYKTEITSGHFAHHKGVLLCDKDIYVKKLITDLICNFSASWNPHYFKAEEQRIIRAQLQKLQHDGLLAMNQSEIQVSEMGRRFIRNICATFDTYLMNSSTSERQFSQSI